MNTMTSSIRNERDADPQLEERRISDLLERVGYRMPSLDLILWDEDLETEAIEAAEENIRTSEIGPYGAFTSDEIYAHHLRGLLIAWVFHCGAKSDLWEEAGGDTELLLHLMKDWIRGHDPERREVPVTVEGWRRYYQYCEPYSSDPVERMRLEALYGG